MYSLWKLVIVICDDVRNLFLSLYIGLFDLIKNLMDFEMGVEGILMLYLDMIIFCCGYW